MAGNFAPRFSRNFLNIFVHILGSIRPIARSALGNISIKSDDVRIGRRAKARHDRFRPAQESMG